MFSCRCDRVCLGEYSEEELWENYTYFIKKVAPVAEAAGVYIGIHPDDPPVYPLGGVPRALFGSFAGYKKAMDIADSPNIGVCLCLGCWLEGGSELMGCGVHEAIRFFGNGPGGGNPWGHNKLFKVHFRNVSNPMPAAWQESLLDEVGFRFFAFTDMISEQSHRCSGTLSVPISSSFVGFGHALGLRRHGFGDAHAARSWI